MRQAACRQERFLTPSGSEALDRVGLRPGDSRYVFYRAVIRDIAACRR
jgi:hypothetical protein